MSRAVEMVKIWLFSEGQLEKALAPYTQAEQRLIREAITSEAAHKLGLWKEMPKHPPGHEVPGPGAPAVALPVADAAKLGS